MRSTRRTHVPASLSSCRPRTTLRTIAPTTDHPEDLPEAGSTEGRRPHEHRARVASTPHEVSELDRDLRDGRPPAQHDRNASPIDLSKARCLADRREGETGLRTIYIQHRALAFDHRSNARQDLFLRKAEVAEGATTSATLHAIEVEASQIPSLRAWREARRVRHRLRRAAAPRPKDFQTATRHRGSARRSPR